jgi:hypothetical protein
MTKIHTTLLTHTSQCTVFTTVIFLQILFFFPAVLCASGDPLEKMLPSAGFSKNWGPAPDEKTTTYTKDTLYTYINGEAELYMPYGFSNLVSALYRKQGDLGSALVVDIFQVRSTIDAFGIYSYYRNPDAEKISIGGSGFIDESQLMFYKDRYFVRLSASGDIPERDVFIACAQAIAKKIPGKSAPPNELALLKVPGIVHGTEKYTAQSVLGYAFFKKGLTADGTLSGRPIKAFVILDKSAKEAAETFSKYSAYLKEKGGKPQLNKGARGVVTLVGRDPLYKGVLVRRSGRYVFGITNLNTP